MFFLFDIGGTFVRTAVSRDGKTLENFSKFSTPLVFDEALSKIGEEFSRASSVFGNLKCVSGGVRSINSKKDSLMADFKLPSWEEKPLKFSLEKITKLPVFLENDTVMAGLGEAVYGSGKKYKIVAYITISTGVNGARVVNGNIDENSFGTEIGHSIIDFDWSFTPEAKQLRDKGFGQFEAYISGGSLSVLLNKPSEEINDEDVWKRVCKSLSIGIINTALYWSPEVVVIGGGLGISDKISLEQLNKNIIENFSRKLVFPKLVKASLGENSGLYGALAYSCKKFL